MRRLFSNRVPYLGLASLLRLVSYPRHSLGAPRGPDLMGGLGLAALVLGAMTPPAQRLLFPPKKDGG